MLQLGPRSTLNLGSGDAILITGGGSGLSIELIKLAYRKYDHLVLIVRNTRTVIWPEDGSLDSLADKVTIYECDLSDDAQIDRLWREHLAVYAFSAFVHIAASFVAGDKSFNAIKEVFSTNVFSAWRLAELLVGKGRAANILFVGSVGHKFGGKRNDWSYSASKYLLEYYPKFLRDCTQQGIQVNTIRLGLMSSRGHKKRGLSKTELKNRELLLPSKKMVTEAEAARFIFDSIILAPRFLHNAVIEFTGGE